MGSIFRKGSEQSGQSQSLSLEQAQTARIQAQLAQEQAAITKPLRVGTANTLSNFVKTGMTPSFLDLAPTVQPLAGLRLPGLEQGQLDLRNSLLAQGSRGGLLQQQLAQGAIQGGLARAELQAQDLLRQQQRDENRSNIARTLFGGAADLGTGGLSQAFSGLGASMAGMGNAAGNLNVLGAQRITQNQIAQQGIGQILGKMLGAGIGGLAGGAPGAIVGSRIGSGQAAGMK